MTITDRTLAGERIRLVIASLKRFEAESKTAAWGNADDASLDFSEEVSQLRAAAAALETRAPSQGGVGVTDEMVLAACDAFHDCNWRDPIKEKMRAALTAAQIPQGSEWRDIASAPKDGTFILCTSGYQVGKNPWGPGGWMQIGVWAHDMRGDGEAWHDGAQIHRVYPTHWMPLPTPPNPNTHEGEVK
jgi:hypothetical protein